MYFDFEDLRPETPSLVSPISRREGVLLSIIVHLAAVIFLLVWPYLPFVKAMRERQAQAIEAQRQKQLEELRNRAQFVFVAPKIDIESKTPPKLADLSDKNRRAQTVERAKEPRNNVPFSRGNSPEHVEGNNGPKLPDEPPAPAPSPARGDTAVADPSTPSPNALTLPDSPTATIAKNDPNKKRTPGPLGEGILQNAIQQHAKSESLQNVQGGGDYGPSIQFDSKGVDFGPWLRRFKAQIEHNWLPPYAALLLKGHVVLSFYVHRDGSISDLTVLKPAPMEAMTRSAVNAIRTSNPTMALPVEYPDDKCMFVVTFYYNEFPSPDSSR
jgi:TonB family protein